MNYIWGLKIYQRNNFKKKNKPKIDTTYEYEIKVTLYNMVSDNLCIRFCVFGFWLILLAGR